MKLNETPASSYHCRVGTFERIADAEADPRVGNVRVECRRHRAVGQVGRVVHKALADDEHVVERGYDRVTRHRRDRRQARHANCNGDC